jgi:hypothetical protein
MVLREFVEYSRIRLPIIRACVLGIRGTDDCHQNYTDKLQAVIFYTHIHEIMISDGANAKAT